MHRGLARTPNTLYHEILYEKWQHGKAMNLLIFSMEDALDIKALLEKLKSYHRLPRETEMPTIFAWIVKLAHNVWKHHA